MSNLRILSRSGEMFKSREEAGRLLATQLAAYQGQKAVVLAVPRGGILVAHELAQALGADLDIVLAHKLRTPGESELAMGSVSEDGKVFLNEDVVRELGVSEAYIGVEKERQMQEIHRRTKLVRDVHPRVPVEGRVAIVTDDGVATGATTQAAIWAVRLEKPGKLVLAVPVGPEDTLQRLAQDVDELICLRSPMSFFAVGQFYANFNQVTDDEVLEILKGYAVKETTK
jgi:predicted phosphoribosyltransferase